MWCSLIAAGLLAAPPAPPPPPAQSPPSAVATKGKAAKGAPAPGAEGLPPGFIPLQRNRRAPTVDDLSDEELLDGLAKFTWAHQTKVDQDPLQPRCPYEHPAVRSLVERAQRDPKIRPTLLTHLRERMKAKGADRSGAKFCSAVALTRLGEQDGLAELDRKLRSRSAKAIEKTAAVYALAERPQALSTAGLTELLDAWFPETPENPPPKGKRRFIDLWSGASPSGTASEDASMIAGALWAYVKISRSRPEFDPVLDPYVRRAVEQGNDVMRRIAAIAYSGRAWESIPAPLDSLLSDSAPLCRSAALAALGQHPTLVGKERALIGARDGEGSVRFAAIELLGKFPGDDTAARIRTFIASDSPAEREAAVRAAAMLGLEDVLYAGVDDKTDRVRAATALVLAARRGEQSLSALRSLLADRSLTVQSAAVEALAQRPLNEAAPCLIEALASPALRVRELASEALARIWPAAGDFPARGTPEIRVQRLGDLTDLWQRSEPQLAAQATSSPPNAGDPRLARGNATKTAAGAGGPGDSPPEKAKKLVMAWHRAGLAERPEVAGELTALGPAVMPVVEQFLLSKNSYPNEEFVSEVMANWDPVYRQLADLNRAGANRQSKPAAELALSLKHRKLTQAQSIVLAEQARRSEGNSSWLTLLPLLERDNPVEAASLDKVGLAHPDPLVRQATCDRIAKRATGSADPMVLDLIRDSSEPVRVAALRAAGRVPGSDANQLLVDSLRTADPRARLAAAGSLTSAGRPEGFDELRRLAFHPSSDVRRRAVRTMAEKSGSFRRESITALTQALGDEKLEVREEAVAALERITGRSFARGAGGERILLEKQITQWKKSLDGELFPKGPDKNGRQLAN